MAVLAFDTFHRANENPLATANWTTPSTFANLQIVSDLCEAASTASAAGEIWTGATPASWPNDQWSEFIIQAAANTMVNYWAMVRTTSGGSGYLLQIPGTLNNAVTATLRTLSPFTQIASFNVTPSAGVKVRLAVQGTSVQTYVNGSLINTTADSSVSAGKPGLVANVTGQAIANVQFSSWRGGDFSAPNPTSISPGFGLPGQTLNVTVSGTSFDSDGGATIAFSGTGITVNSYSVQNSTTITANITISGGAATGARNVVVTNESDGQTGTLVNGFVVSSFVPQAGAFFVGL